MRRLIAIGCAAIAAVAFSDPPALAAGGVNCPPGTPVCVIEVEKPGDPIDPGTPDPGGTEVIERRCTVSATGKDVPCHSDVFGWFNDGDDCYWRRVEAQPPATDPIWAGHYPEGAVYSVACAPTHPGGSDGWEWAPTDPPGYGGTGVTPAQLAQRAVAQLALTGPAIRMTIEGDEDGLVGSRCGCGRRSDRQPGAQFGDRLRTRLVGDCYRAGAADRVGHGRRTHRDVQEPRHALLHRWCHVPTCQHIYEQSSAGQANEAFPVTATTTWDVTWTGGGASGALTVTRQSTASVRIGELQVLITQE